MTRNTSGQVFNACGAGLGTSSGSLGDLGDGNVSLRPGEPANLAHVDDEGHRAIAKHGRACEPLGAAQTASQGLDHELEPVDHAVDHDAEALAVDVDDRGELLGGLLARNAEEVA